jgi:hypothetical protein
VLTPALTLVVERSVMQQLEDSRTNSQPSTLLSTKSALIPNHILLRKATDHLDQNVSTFTVDFGWFEPSSMGYAAQQSMLLTPLGRHGVT